MICSWLTPGQLPKIYTKGLFKIIKDPQKCIKNMHWLDELKVIDYNVILLMHILVPTSITDSI